MDMLEFKKQYKELYQPKETPVIATVPALNFIMIEGKGDPNEEEFALAVAAMYSLSYAVKMSYKSKNIPEGYYEYSVFPLEGVWDLFDKNTPTTDKSNFSYTIMIRQPDFLTDELFARFVTETKKKKPNRFLETAIFSAVTEGLCCQMLHIGSYDDEPASFDKMLLFCMANGWERISRQHREIYLSDPRRTEPSKLKTVLRFQVKAV